MREEERPLAFRNVTGISTNQNLMGIKFNTTVFYFSSVNLEICRGCWARHEAEGGSLIGLTTFDTHNRTHSPAVRDTTDPNLQQKPRFHRMSAQPRASFPPASLSTALCPSERLLRSFKKVFVKTTRHPGIWVTVKKHATKRLDFICAAQHKDLWPAWARNYTWT